jgi:hypothetical protein
MEPELQSAKITLYKALAGRLIEQVPEVVWIDRFNNQPVRRGEMYAYPLPAVFIAFAALPWQSLGLGAQAAEATIRLHVEQECYSDSYYGSYAEYGMQPARSLEASLRRDELLASIHAALQGFEGAVFTPLQRGREVPDVEADVTTIDTVEYTTTLQEVLPMFAHEEVDGVAPQGNIGD